MSEEKCGTSSLGTSPFVHNAKHTMIKKVLVLVQCPAASRDSRVESGCIASPFGGALLVLAAPLGLY